MSTLAATNLKHASSASNNIVLDSSGNATFAGTPVPASSFLRNRIINGAMAIDQRNAGAAVTPSSAAIAYCVDRFYTAASTTVSGTVTVQRVATNAPGESQFCLRLARTSGSYAGSITVGQTIETANCYDLAGKSITISFRARRGSAYSASTIGINCYTGTAADQGSAGGVAGTWTGWANVGSASFTPTTSFATYSLTVSIGASVQEIQTNITTGLFSGSGSADDFVEITNVQLEVGSVATPFERRQYGQELALCQRYYQRDVLVTVGGGATPTVTNRSFYNAVQWPVQMRAAPTMALINTIASTNMNAGSWAELTASRGRFTATNSVANDCNLFVQYDAAAEL